MRGKLRDKRATTKREFVKREVLEQRRRPAKRDSRSSWLHEQSLEDDELEFELDEEEAEDVKEENSSPKK